MFFKIAIACGLFITLALVVYFFISKSYYRQYYQVLQQIKPHIKATLENVHISSMEKDGLKNSFPPPYGVSKCIVHLTDLIILILPKSKFPYIYNANMSSFILAKDAESVNFIKLYSYIYSPYKTELYKDSILFHIQVKGIFCNLKVQVCLENLTAEQIAIIRNTTWIT